MFTTVQQCKRLYKDILLGYSYSHYNKGYIKHFSESDFGLLEDKTQEFVDHAVSKGISSEKDTLVFLDKHGHWTKSEEEGYQSSIQEIRDLLDQLRTLYLKEQVEQLNKFIKDKQAALEDLHVKRAALLSITAESYADRKHQEEIVKLSFYKDSQFTELFYSDEVFDDLDISDLRKIFLSYTTIMFPYSDKNIRKISTCPFFLNLFSLCEDDAHVFYGKPICTLSTYQVKLLEFAKTNTVILKDEGKGPPEDYYKDLDKVIHWFDTRYQILVGKSSEARQRNNTKAR